MRSSGFALPRVVGASALGLALVTGAVWGIATWLAAPEEASLVPKELSAAALKEQVKNDPDKLAETMRETFRRDDLTDEQRREVRGNMRQAWEGALDERIDEYYAAAPGEREAILDRQIEDWQERMKRWQERRNEREKEREARRGQEGQEADDGQTERERRRRWRGTQTREQRKARSESRNPDKVARRTAYFMAVRKRAQARGLEMYGPHGGSRGGQRGRGRS